MEKSAARVVGLGLIGLASLSGLLPGCSSKDSHPPAIGGCEGDACTPTNPINPGTNDTGVAEIGDTELSADASSLTVSGNVVVLDDYTRSPETASTSAATTLSVHAFGPYGVPINAVVTAGAFSLSSITPQAPFTWLDVRDGTAVKTVFAVDPTDTAGLTTLKIPLYTADLAVLATTVLGHAPAAGTSTVVLRCIDSAGKLIKGAKASLYATSGPYYDDGAGSVVSSSGTDVRGTVVYFEVSPGAFPVTITPATGSPRTISVSLKPDAVSYAEVGLQP